MVCLWIQQKAPFLLNQETSIRYDDYYTLDKNCKLCTVREAFPFFLQKLREGLLFIIFQYVFKMFSLLAVPGQVIPGGSESPFCAAGLRQCRAWNPITSAAMLALWHQTPSMQNAPLAFTSNVLHSSVPAEGFTDGWPGWQGAGEMTLLTLMRDKVENRKRGWECGWGRWSGGKKCYH